jgi:hypothetical protein
MMYAPDRKASALGYALLIYMSLVVVAITLLPFDFRIPARIHINLHGSVTDVLANIVLFIPLGFLFHLSRRRGEWRNLLGALCFGMLVSTAVETCQLFLPGRDSSVLEASLFTGAALYDAIMLRSCVPELHIRLSALTRAERSLNHMRFEG